MAKIITEHRIGRNGAIRVGCSAVIFDKDREKILLTRREDNRFFGQKNLNLRCITLIR